MWKVANLVSTSTVYLSGFDRLTMSIVSVGRQSLCTAPNPSKPSTMNRMLVEILISNIVRICYAHQPMSIILIANLSHTNASRVDMRN